MVKPNTKFTIFNEHGIFCCVYAVKQDDSWSQEGEKEGRKA